MTDANILLVSTYELGHQPLHLAAPAAALRAAGHEVRTLDLSVEEWDPALIAWADRVAFSVPMHTAMRLAVEATAQVRKARPEVPVAYYGLYAGIGTGADAFFAGEYGEALVAWAGGGSPASGLHLRRSPAVIPARELTPPLDRYARLQIGDEERVVGYVEASHGCAFRCRHCPVPVVYDGRLRIVAEEAVLADVTRLVAAGARHVTFGDPDFLAGARHGQRVMAAVHETFPDLTFDITTKVELILRHESIWAEFADAGCLFVVSAFETVDDATLARLDKGHTGADAAAAVQLLRRHGIEVRPSWMPFTPWTTVDDVVALFDFVAAQGLAPNVDPVQYTIRLLLPPGSLLLDHPDLAPHLGEYDRERLSWSWTSADARADELQRALAALVEHDTALDRPPWETYAALDRLVRGGAGAAADLDALAADWAAVPRLSEPWFCCAEPTDLQRLTVR